MKRRLFFMATALLTATTAFATEQSDTLNVKTPRDNPWEFTVSIIKFIR